MGDRWWIETSGPVSTCHVVAESVRFGTSAHPRSPGYGDLPCHVGLRSTEEWLRTIWEEPARHVDDRRRPRTKARR